MIETTTSFADLLIDYLILSPQLIWMVIVFPFYYPEWVLYISIALIIPLTIWSLVDPMIPLKSIVAALTSPLWIWVIWSFWYWINPNDARFLFQ